MFNNRNELKITDLGYGRLSSNEQENLHIYTRISPYRAPEMIFNLDYDNKGIGQYQ